MTKVDDQSPEPGSLAEKRHRRAIALVRGQQSHLNGDIRYWEEGTFLFALSFFMSSIAFAMYGPGGDQDPVQRARMFVMVAACVTAWWAHLRVYQASNAIEGSLSGNLVRILVTTWSAAYAIWLLITVMIRFIEAYRQ